MGSLSSALSGFALFVGLFGHPLPTPAQAPQKPATSASIVTCFVPEEPCGKMAAATIGMAHRQILVQAYTFTLGSDIAQKLIDAKHLSGVDVQVIVDKTTPCERGTAVPMLQQAGIPVYVDDSPDIAHQKTLIIDDLLVVEGSMNWSAKAERYNVEDLNVITSPYTAQAYIRHWISRQKVSMPYTGPVQWCKN